MESISRFTECMWCHSQLCDPVILPCGDSICQKHTKDLEKVEWKCCLCDGEHKLDEGERFPVNNVVLALLTSNLSRLDFGQSFREAKESVEAVDAKYKEMMMAVRDPQEYVCSLVRKYKAQLDLGREEMNKIVDDAYQEMDQNIMDFKQTAEQNLETHATKMNELTESMGAKIKEWKDMLTELVVNEPLWKQISLDVEELRKQIDQQHDEILRTSSTLKRLPISFESNVYRRLAIGEPKNTATPFRRRMFIRNIAETARAKSRDPEVSKKVCVIGDFRFSLVIEFCTSGDKMYLGAYLSLIPKLKQNVDISLSWRFKVYGSDGELIRSRDCMQNIKKPWLSWGYNHLISFKDIMAHPSYDPQHDMVLIELEIDRDSIKATQTKKKWSCLFNRESRMNLIRDIRDNIGCWLLKYK